MTPVIAVSSGMFDAYGAASSAESNAVSYASSAANTAYSNAVSYVNGRVINDLFDVTITGVANGDFLRYNGTAWINDPVNLSTDTVGNYVQSLVAGTGITLTNNSGEGSTPTVEVNTAVIAPIASPTFTGTVTLPDNTVALGVKTTGNYVQSVVAGVGIDITNGSGEGSNPTISLEEDPLFNTVTTEYLIVDGIEIDTTGAAFGQVLKFNGVKFIPGEDNAEEGVGTVSKYSSTIGDGANTVFTITHSLATRDVVVEIYETVFYQTIYAAVKRVNLNSIEVTFSTPPDASSRRVVITG